MIRVLCGFALAAFFVGTGNAQIVPKIYHSETRSGAKGIPGVQQGDLVFISPNKNETTLEIYKFSAFATDAGDDDRVLVSSGGAGKWLRIASTSEGGGGGGGGGDTIWTNNAGTFALIGSTNVILNPDVADGASAVAFSLNSSNALSTAGAKLVTFGNGETNVFNFGAKGYMEIIGDLSEIFGGSNESMRPYWDLSVSPTTAYFLLYGGNNTGLYFEPTISDGNTPYTFDTSLAHTSGNLAEFKNNGTNVLSFGPSGGGNYMALDSINGTFGEFSVNSPNTLTYVDLLVTDSVAGVSSVIGNNIDGGYMIVRINSSVPANDQRAGHYAFQANDSGGQMQSIALVESTITDITRTSIDSKVRIGWMENVNGFPGSVPTQQQPNTFASFSSAGLEAPGKVGAVSGFSSTATDAAVTIAATGWTNTFGKNAVVYLTGTNTTYTVFNNAGTAVYTNLTTTGVLNTSVLIQPSGAVVVSGTAVFGRATPF